MDMDFFGNLECSGTIYNNCCSIQVRRNLSQMSNSLLYENRKDDYNLVAASINSSIVAEMMIQIILSFSIFFAFKVRRCLPELEKFGNAICCLVRELNTQMILV